MCLSLCLYTNRSQAQTAGIRHFYNKYKHSPEAEKIKLPGWVLHLGAGLVLALDKDLDESERAGIKLMKKIKKLRMLSLENSNPVSPEDYNSLIKSVKKDHFEDLISVRDGKTKVNIMIREKKDVIRNILILVSDEDEFILFSVSSKIKIEDINKLLKMVPEKEQQKILKLPKEIRA